MAAAVNSLTGPICKSNLVVVSLCNRDGAAADISGSCRRVSVGSVGQGWAPVFGKSRSKNRVDLDVGCIRNTDAVCRRASVATCTCVEKRQSQVDSSRTRQKRWVRFSSRFCGPQLDGHAAFVGAPRAGVEVGETIVFSEVELANMSRFDSRMEGGITPNGEVSAGGEVAPGVATENGEEGEGEGLAAGNGPVGDGVKAKKPKKKYRNQRKVAGEQGNRPGKLVAREKVSRQMIGNIVRALQHLKEEDDIELVLEKWKHRMTAKDVCLVIQNEKVPMETVARFVALAAEVGRMKENVYAHNIYLKRLTGARMLEQAEEFVERMIAGENEAAPTAVTFTTLIEGLRRGGFHAAVRKWYVKMKELKVPNNDVSRFMILRACGTAEFVDLAEEIYKEMKASRSPISLQSFNIMVTLYGKEGRVEDAERILDEMKERGVKPNEFTYNTVISLWRRLGQVELALAMFERMQREGVEASDMTYNTVLSMYARRGMFMEGEKVLSLLGEYPKGLPRPTYSLGINMYRRAGMYDQAVALWRKMVESGCSPDMAAYGGIMEVYGKMGDWEEAERIWKELQDAGSECSKATYRGLLMAYVKGGRKEDADRLYEEMCTKGMERDHFACALMLGLYGQMGMVARAAHFYQLLRASGLLREHIVWSVLLDLFGKTDHRGMASRVLRHIEALGCCAEEATYTILIDVFGRASLRSKAEEMFAALKNEAIASSGACGPNVVTFTSMITMYGRLRDIDAVKRTWDDMNLSGISADEGVFRAVIDAYGKSGMADVAQEFSAEMEGKGMMRYDTIFKGRQNEIANFDDAEDEEDDEDDFEGWEIDQSSWEKSF